jgi:hypothetical protein
MSTTTTNDNVFNLIDWIRELTGILDVQKKLMNEMELLPRTPELLMYYEKLYLPTIDANAAHYKLSSIHIVVRNREKYKLLNTDNETLDIAMRGYEETIATLQEERRNLLEPRDWDKYFLYRPLNLYSVHRCFKN